MMAAEGHWTIRPRQGLGRLDFGMSPAQVDALSDVYGAVSGRGNDRAADALLHETLEMFGGARSARTAAKRGPDAPQTVDLAASGR